MKEIKNINEFNEAIASDGVKVIDFFATWCGPCKLYAKVLESVTETELNGAQIIKVNIDSIPDAAAKHGVMSIPTTLFVKNGEIKEKITGLIQKDKVLSVLKSM